MTAPDFYRASALEDAVEKLASLGDDGAMIAGGTWVLRAPVRGEDLKSCYVSLRDVEELYGIRSGDTTEIGALATHTQLAAIGNGVGALSGIAEAARKSAFRAVQNVATVGGNICASPFPEADLVPALLAAETSVEVASSKGGETIDLGSYLGSRSTRAAGEIIVTVKVPTPSERRAAYERLAVRGGGEYPVATVAVSLDFDGDGAIDDVRIAVGSVEEVARRANNAEAVLRGKTVEDSVLEEAGEALAGEVDARDGVDAPGWYRRAVLPTLLRRAIARIDPSSERA